MHTDTHKDSHYLRAAGVFAVCLLAVFAFQFIAIYANSFLPARFTNLLFFSSELFFPYEGFVTRGATGSHAVFSQGVGRMLMFVHWGLVAAVFTLAARRVPLRHTIFAAIATIILVGVATLLVFGVFGVSVDLDGP